MKKAIVLLIILLFATGCSTVRQPDSGSSTLPSSSINNEMGEQELITTALLGKVVDEKSYSLGSLMEGRVIENHFYTAQYNNSIVQIDINTGVAKVFIAPDGLFLIRPYNSGLIFRGVDGLQIYNHNFEYVSSIAYPSAVSDLIKQRVNAYFDLSDDMTLMLYTDQVGDSATSYTNGVWLHSFETGNTIKIMDADHYYYWPMFIQGGSGITASRSGGLNGKEYVYYDITADILTVIGCEYDYGSQKQIFQETWPYVIFENGFYDLIKNNFFSFDPACFFTVKNEVVFYIEKGRLFCRDTETNSTCDLGMLTTKTIDQVRWINTNDDNKLLAVFFSYSNSENTLSGLYAVDIPDIHP